jgi:hypothetical protein
MPTSAYIESVSNKRPNGETEMSDKTAKMDGLIAKRTLGQIIDMVKMLWSDHRPEAAIVRARIYAHLCGKYGETTADEIFEDQP